MSSKWQEIQEQLRDSPKYWCVTGVAGFIGSNLLQELLRLNQKVVGLDNFSTGHKRNLDEVGSTVGPDTWRNFTFVEGDIREERDCHRACEGADFVLHQAALGSVPRSISDPIATNESNVDGFVKMLCAARDAGVKRFVYASSSSVYGDHPALPKVEAQIGNCLSPYAVSKRVNELYADAFARCYGMQCLGLRYFNVFGPRQDPEGPYAAVIPKWVAAMMRNDPVYINGDGETSRDFCFVANVVQANLLAATTTNPGALNQVFNVALHDRTTLNSLYQMLRERLLPDHPHLKNARPLHRDFRPGDVRHSEAEIARARELLGYEPTHGVSEGLDEALPWYRTHME